MGEFNNYKYIEFVEAKTADELKAMIRSLTLPFEVIEIYQYEGKHIAWLNLSRNIIKVDKKTLKET